jgi:hypothetical protein
VSVGDGSSAVPPGWYPDPADDARLRRWDGHVWTQDVILNPDGGPVVAAVQPAPSAPPVQSAPAEPYFIPAPAHQAPPAPAAPIFREPEPEPAPPIFHEPAPAAPIFHEPAPAAPIFHEPTAAPIYHEPSAPVIVHEPTSPSMPAEPTVIVHSAPAPNQPPMGRPVPASPAPSEAPPGAPTVPRPSPPVNQHPNPPSGPVSLPEWASLPGLTLPPDLSSIPGLGNDSVLGTPTFAEPVQRGLPTLPVFEPPFIPQRPDVQDAGPGRAGTANSKPDAAPQSATPYAPPPVGAQYDVPPPPGMAHVPGAGPLLPPSALVSPVPSAPGWSQLPTVGSAPVSSSPAAPVEKRASHASSAQPAPSLASGPATIAVWMIGLLPLIQFAVVYVCFGVLGYTLLPGMQWGILIAPAALSLLFANSDRTKLAKLGAPSPNIPFAALPPLYLLVRCITTGRSSVGPLVLWIVLQIASIVGVLNLLPALLSVPIPPFG